MHACSVFDLSFCVFVHAFFLGSFVVEHGCMHALSLSFPFGFLYMLSFLVVLLLNMVACRSLFELSFCGFVDSFLSWRSCIVEHGCTNDMFLLCAILLFELLFVAFVHAFLVSFVVVEHGCLYARMLTLFEFSFVYLFMLSFLVFLWC